MRYFRLMQIGAVPVALLMIPAMIQAAGVGQSATTTAASADQAKPVPAKPNFDSDGDGKPDAWDTNGDGKADAWDTNGDGKPDAWDTNGDGKPDTTDKNGDGKPG